MSVNKVFYGQQVLIDLTGDTVTPERLQAGYTAHQANGQQITGTGLIYNEGTDLTPIVFDYNVGFIGVGSSTVRMYFKEENPTLCYCDVYEIEAGKEYVLSLDTVIGTRFRAGLADTYTDFSASNTINLHGVIFLEGSPTVNQKVFFSNNFGKYPFPYLIVQKDNAGTTGLITHLREVEY